VKKILHFIYLLLINSHIVIAQSAFSPLPENEKEAEIMLKDGLIDSVTWRMVEPYYEQPVSVTEGELNLLTGIFPDLLKHLPVKNELQNYEPWSKNKIDEFFTDYPELLNLKPVLSFETSNRRYSATAGLALREYQDSIARLNTHFSYDLNGKITSSGRAVFTDSSALWQRRSISVLLHRKCSITAGNYDFDFDRGLLLGNFPSCEKDSGIASNWLYASSNSWNGVLAEYTGGNFFKETGFIHARPSETIYGMKSSLHLGNSICFHAGISHASVRSYDTCSFHCLNAGLTLSYGSTNAGVLADAEDIRSTKIPFMAYMQHKSGKAGFSIAYSRIPDSCHSIFSQIQHTCSGRLLNNDTLKSTSNSTKVQCVFPAVYEIKSMMGASYYHAAGMDALESFLALSGSKSIDYTFRYTVRASTSAGTSRHAFSVNACKKATHFLSMNIQGRYVLSNDTSVSVYARCNVVFFPRNGYEAAFFISAYSGMSDKREFMAGLSHYMKLSGKTYSRIKLELPLKTTYSKKWMLNAETCFYM
jgi:hypothetical protein